MLYVYLWLKAWMSEEEGQDLIEYVLIAGLIALGRTLASNYSGWRHDQPCMDYTS